VPPTGADRGGKQALRTLVDEIARTRIAGHMVDAEAFEGVRLRIERKMLDEYERGERSLAGGLRVG
jgi:hypothetical protein